MNIVGTVILMSVSDSTNIWTCCGSVLVISMSLCYLVIPIYQTLYLKIVEKLR